jgi:hypothetical protein
LKTLLASRFGQNVTDWLDTVATIDTDALIGGTLRTFYLSGAAVFTTLTIKGNASETYDMLITLTGPDLCVCFALALKRALTACASVCCMLCALC